MTDFNSNPTVIKSHEMFDIVQSGPTVMVVAKSPRVHNDSYATLLTIAEIEANSRHFARAIVPALKAKGAVAFVIGKVDGKTAQFALNSDEYAKGAGERARYAAWAAETSAARAFFDGMNEGGEGYNPYRS